MAKSVEITPRILALINSAAGAEVDPKTVTVFEARAINTKPLMKRGSIFENATMARSTLEEMCAALNGGESVPLHTLHEQGYELPVGKLIEAQLFDLADGSSEVRALFYLVNDTQPKLIADINAGVIDEVSVGVRPKKMLCSECGWDFNGPDATGMHLWDRTCANDHTIGKSGVHLNLVGLDKWMEMSLVSKGAARNAKIVSRAKQQLAASEIEKLAASGRPAETQIVVATVEKQEDTNMSDLNTLVAQLTKSSGELALANAAVGQGKTALASASTKITELEAKIAELSAKIEQLTAAAGDGGSTLADTQAKLDAASKIVADVTAFLADEAKKALVAAGKKDEAVAADAGALVEQIKATQLSLLNLIPAGGRSVAADAGADTAQKKQFGAFKVKG